MRKALKKIDITENCDSAYQFIAYIAFGTDISSIS